MTGFGRSRVSVREAEVSTLSIAKADALPQGRQSFSHKSAAVPNFPNLSAADRIVQTSRHFEAIMKQGAVYHDDFHRDIILHSSTLVRCSDDPRG